MFGTKQNLKKVLDQKPNSHILDSPIKQVFQCKTFGVILDENLSWKSNTDAICKKISSGIYALKRMRDFVDRKTLISVYNAIIHPYFTHCCEVWDVLLGWETLEVQRLKSKAKMMFKILHHLGPPSLKKLFNLKKKNHCSITSVTVQIRYVCLSLFVTAWKRVSCMMELRHGTPFRKSLETTILKRKCRPSLS